MDHHFGDFGILIVLLLPMLYAKINEFISSLIQGVQWISFKIKEIGNLKDFSLVNSLIDNIIKLLEAYDDWMPGLVSSLPSWMSTIFGLCDKYFIYDHHCHLYAV